MPYTITRAISGASFDDVDARVRRALASSGFGVLTEIDVQATMKKKLGADMPAYRILGACNPQMAFQAIAMEPRVGAVLPCNVILRQIEGLSRSVRLIPPRPCRRSTTLNFTRLPARCGRCCKRRLRRSEPRRARDGGSPAYFSG